MSKSTCLNLCYRGGGGYFALFSAAAKCIGQQQYEQIEFLLSRATFERARDEENCSAMSLIGLFLLTFLIHLGASSRCHGDKDLPSVSTNNLNRLCFFAGLKEGEQSISPSCFLVMYLW